MADSDLKAGVYWRGITPPLGVDLCGYGFFADRKAMLGVKSLHAQALVLEQKRTRVALVSLDLIGMSDSLVQRTKEMIEQMAGIAPENVVLACTHTHSGPVTVELIGGGEPDPDYLSMLTRQIASAVVQACDELEEVNVYSGQATLVGLAKNRAQSDGAIDTSVQTLEFLSGDSDNSTVLFSFGCHPVSTPVDDKQLNPDFPQRARSILQSEYEDALFLQGSCGDIEPILAHENETGRAGQMLAGAALMAVGGAKSIESLHPLRVVSKTIALPIVVPSRSELERKRDDYRALMTERAPNTPEGKKALFWLESSEALLAKVTAEGAESRNLWRDAPVLPCTVTAIQIGDVVLLTHPCELFAEYGMEIRRNSPFTQTFVVGCANGFLGYIANEAEFARKGYAVELAPAQRGQFPFKSNVGRVFTDACLAFLMELYRG